MYKDLWDRIPDFDIENFIEGGALKYDLACKAIMSRSSNLASGSHCVTHDTHCTSSPIDGEVAGSPCIAWSRASATRKGRNHPVTGLLLAWCAWVLFAKPKVAIHENVIGFDTNVLEELLGAQYFIQHIRVSPSHMGFAFIGRPRVYSVLMLRTALRRRPPDLPQVYGRIVDAMQYQAADSVAWVWRATDAQLLEEENRVRAKRGFAPALRRSTDWTYLLTVKQRARLNYHTQASTGSVWDLTQSPKFGKTRA